MLRQPIADRPDDASPQEWLVLATERLREFHAGIAALDAKGKPSWKPEAYRRLGTRSLAEGWHRELHEAGSLDHARWTYTIFRAS